jgi:hypothetical protein
VKRLLRYLKGTQEYGIHISPQSDTLVGHADADWGGESDCFGVCLVRQRRELCVRWQDIGHKDEEAVLCANSVTSYPVPQSTRRTGVFIDFRASDATAYSASRRETGEASFVLRVELTKAMYAVR